MVQWEKIHSIRDEDILKFLGSNRVAFRGDGYYTKRKDCELYVMVAGNGVIIQFHNCSYVLGIVKKEEPVSTHLLSDKKKPDIFTYAMKEVHGMIDEKHWVETYKEMMERDFIGVHKKHGKTPYKIIKEENNDIF